MFEIPNTKIPNIRNSIYGIPFGYIGHWNQILLGEFKEVLWDSIEIPMGNLDTTLKDLIFSEGIPMGIFNLGFFASAPSLLVLIKIS